MAKIEEILGQIKAFKNDNRFLRQAFQDLVKFLDGDTHVRT